MKNQYKIREISWPEKQFIIIRDTVPFDGLSDFFEKNYSAIYEILEKHGIKSNGPPCAIYYSIDEVNKKTDLAAAVPVPMDSPKIEDFFTVIIPNSKVITTTHIGSYDKMEPAYTALENYLKANNLNRILLLEEYLSDPEIEKDSSKWVTNIYFVIG